MIALKEDELPSRWWWYEKDEWDWSPYRLLDFAADEWCNRTVVLRLWKPLVIALNVPLRRVPCEDCRQLL